MTYALMETVSLACTVISGIAQSIRGTPPVDLTLVVHTSTYEDEGGGGGGAGGIPYPMPMP